MRRSRSTRLVAPALAAAGVLLLGGCGLLGGDDEESDSGSAEDQGADQGGEGNGEERDEETGTDGLQGTWVTGFDEPYNALVIAGDTATFVKDGGSEVCTGPALNDTLALVCQSGNTEFTAATLDRRGDQLAVSWDAGDEETYQRADDAALQQLPGLEDIPGLEELEEGLEDLQDLQDTFDE